MKVYRVFEDLNYYQSLQPEDFSLINTYFMDMFQGVPVADIWHPPKVFSLYPKLKAGDFWGFFLGSLCSTPEATDKIYPFFEMAGEILPLPYKEQEFSVLNITECINTLDVERSEWLLTEDGQRIFPTKYVFHNRFSESTLFKLPENNSVDIFALERHGNPEEEFKAFVEAEKMEGLTFKLLWSDEFA